MDFTEENLKAWKEEPLCDELQDWVDDGPLGPWVRHPLVYSDLMLPGLCNRQLETKRAALEEALNTGNWHSYIWLHERPYRTDALMFLRDRLDPDDYWGFVRDVWIDSENLWQNLGEWNVLWTADLPDRSRFVMLDEEREALTAMPDPIVVYRGGDGGNIGCGMSWTVDRERALWFAKRWDWRNKGDEFAGPAIWHGTVTKDDVLAYFTGRGEEEIVAFEWHVEVTDVEML